MIPEDELSLGETTPTPAADAEENNPGDEAAAVENFDVDAWINDATPMRRAITLYADLAAHAEVDLLEARIFEAEHSNAKATEISKLREARDAAMQKVKDSSLDIVIEGWAPAKARTFLAALDKRLSDEEKGRQLLAAQIIEPRGINGTFIKKLEENLPTEYAGLLVRYAELQQACGAINNAPFLPNS